MLHNPDQSNFKELELELQNFIQQEEMSYNGKRKDLTDSLWSHSFRVAALAEKIGAEEGVDSVSCRLAGLFHDSGKFVDGTYHSGSNKEEDGSVKVFYEMTAGKGIKPEIVDSVARAILEIYSNTGELSLLAKILFDADNLDKLGLSGVCNFFIKAGLRGKGLNQALLYKIGVELTYARYASQIMMTSTARKLAAEKAPETIGFYYSLLESLKREELFDVQIETVDYKGMILDIVTHPLCVCGGQIERKIWDAADLKCQKIYVEHKCRQCTSSFEYQFCRPLLFIKE